MTVRYFTARASAANAPRYYRFFKDTLTPALRALEGHRGALVLSRPNETLVEITVLTFWDSMESIARFAGETPEKAVVEPEARELLTSFDEHIEHYTVELNTLT